MYLAFLIISALDLLGVLETVCNAQERQEYIDWIYHCQHPHGGFRMWPGTDLGDRANAENARWDPANVPATYFALAMLLILGDDFKRVKRKQTLEWLRLMQRPDGSFAETLVNGQHEGGRDPRLGYTAMGVRYILRGRRDQDETEDLPPDIDIDALVDCVKAAESYDGGIGDIALSEPHAGYTYCALGCLNFLNRLNHSSTSPPRLSNGPSNPQEVLRWLVHRQTHLLEPDPVKDFSDSTTQPPLLPPTAQPSATHPSTSTSTLNSTPAHQSPDKTVLTPFPSTSPILPCPPFSAGFNGRPNKAGDTCYAFWSLGSLSLLLGPDQIPESKLDFKSKSKPKSRSSANSLIDAPALRRYLLGQVQHPILGGFGKFPGDLPDIYHSYLGLAALSLASPSSEDDQEEGGGGDGEVKAVDAGMCLSVEASGRVEGLWEKF